MTRAISPIRLLLFCALALLPDARELFAQEQSGGHAAGFLRRISIPDEVARAGAYTPFAPSSLTLFTNSAALPLMEHPSVALSASLLPFGQRMGSLSLATDVGEFGGMGVGLLYYGIGDVPRRTGDGTRQGTIGDQELAVVAGGGMQIGPGSIGATILYLRQDIQGVPEGESNGYAVDVSGTLSFRNELLFAFSMASLAGEMRSTATGSRDVIPWQARLGASYIHALDDAVEITRADPSGLPSEHRTRPDAYILGVTEITMSQFDSTVVSLAVEAVPLASIPFGLRGGWNSNGDLSLGLMIGIPTEITRELRFTYAALRESELGEITQHLSLTFGF